MVNFKVGDRVRVSKKISPYCKPELQPGAIGKITHAGTIASAVKIDGLDNPTTTPDGWYYDNEELEKIGWLRYTLLSIWNR